MKVGNNKQLLVALGMAAFAATSVSAQSSGFDKPLKSGQPTSAGPGTVSGTTTMFMSQSDGDDQYEVRIQDGKVTAKVNGKTVPQDRVVQDKDGIKIMDEDGKVVTTFHVSKPDQAPAGAVSRGRTGARAAPVAPKPPEPPKAMNIPGWQAPKVMLGINMSEPGPDLLKAFKLNPGESILIDRVIEGLPADQAGLQENDVVTEINGKKPATPETLRDVLKDKEPGDTVTFTVMRKGGDKTIRVKLVKYDAEKLGAPMAAQDWPQIEVPGMDEPGKKKIEGAMRGAPQGLELRWPQGGEAPIIVGPEGGVFRMAPNAKLDSKIEELDKKLAELDKKMAKLDDLFAKLQAQLEKLPKDAGR